MERGGHHQQGEGRWVRRRPGRRLRRRRRRRRANDRQKDGGRGQHFAAMEHYPSHHVRYSALLYILLLYHLLCAGGARPSGASFPILILLFQNTVAERSKLTSRCHPSPRAQITFGWARGLRERKAATDDNGVEGLRPPAAPQAAWILMSVVTVQTSH